MGKLRELLPHLTEQDELDFDSPLVYGWQVFTKTKWGVVTTNIRARKETNGKTFKTTAQLVEHLKETEEDGSWDVMIYNKA